MKNVQLVLRMRQSNSYVMMIKPRGWGNEMFSLRGAIPNCPSIAVAGTSWMVIPAFSTIDPGVGT